MSHLLICLQELQEVAVAHAYELREVELLGHAVLYPLQGPQGHLALALLKMLLQTLHQHLYNTTPQNG